MQYITPHTRITPSGLTAAVDMRTSQAKRRRIPVVGVDGHVAAIHKLLVVATLIVLVHQLTIVIAIVVRRKFKICMAEIANFISKQGLTCSYVNRFLWCKRHICIHRDLQIHHGQLQDLMQHKKMLGSRMPGYLSPKAEA